MSKNNLLLIGGIGLVALLVMNKQSGGGSPLLQLGDIVAGGDSPDGGTGGIFGSALDLSFLDGLFADINTNFANMGERLGALEGGLTDVTDFLGQGGGLLGDGGGEGEGGGGQGWLDPIQPSGNIVIDLANSLGKVASAGLVGGGAYLGFKALAPAVPAIGRVLASGAGGLNTMFSGAGGAGRGLIGTTGSALSAPATLSVGTIGAVAATGVGSYLGTTWLLENTSIGKAIGGATQDWAGKAGDWVFGRDSSKPEASVKKMAANQYGYTTSDIQKLQNDYDLVGGAAVAYMKTHIKRPKI